MNNKTEIGIFLTLVLGIVLINFISELKQQRKDKLSKEKHFCNNCRLAYVRRKELKETHCKECGKELEEYKGE